MEIWGDRAYGYSLNGWKSLRLQDIQNGQKYEGAIYYELSSSPSYLLTYNRFGEVIRFQLPSNVANFNPMEKIIKFVKYNMKWIASFQRV